MYSEATLKLLPCPTDLFDSLFDEMEAIDVYGFNFQCYSQFYPKVFFETIFLLEI